MWSKDLRKYLNIKEFKQIENRINELKLNATKLDDKDFEHMEDKYKIVNGKPYKEMDKNLLYVLALSHQYNMMKRQRGMFMSMNFLKNSEAYIEFCELVKESNNMSEYAVCMSLNNVFGKKHFSCVSMIPKDIMRDLISNEKILS